MSGAPRRRSVTAFHAPRRTPCPAPSATSSSSTASAPRSARPATKGIYAETRADDLVIRCIRELLRRNPELPPERVDEVAIAATTQIGDQGLTIGRTAALLAGLPQTVPGYSIDRMCAGAMTAVTTTASGIAFGAYDVAIAGGVEHMGRHPMGEGVDPNPRFVSEKLVDPSALVMGATAENLHDRFPDLTKERCRRVRRRQPGEGRQGRYADGRIQPDLVPVATRSAEQGWGLATADEPPRPGTTLEDLADAEDAVPPARPGHRGQRRRPQRRRDRLPRSPPRTPRPSSACRSRMRLVGYAFAGVEPEVMGVGPVPGDREGAAPAPGCASTTSACSSSTRRSPSRCWRSSTTSASPTTTRGSTRDGGAIAIGHPLASSGVRLMTQLARQFEEQPDVRYGLTAMCIGIGMGGTVIWENPHHGDYGKETEPDERPRQHDRRTCEARPPRRCRTRS